MANPNPNPKSRFQPGHKPAGRKPGQPNFISRDIKTLIRNAAKEVGFVERVPVLDAAGKPTGQMELRSGKDGEAGYLRWLAINHPQRLHRGVRHRQGDWDMMTSRATVVFGGGILPFKAGSASETLI
jgi:hypothetical protein